MLFQNISLSLWLNECDENVSTWDLGFRNKRSLGSVTCIITWLCCFLMKFNRVFTSSKEIREPLILGDNDAIHF